MPTALDIAIEVISLGAGVQSSTLALMAAAGDIVPMPTCAVFADTQAEPAAVYKWLDIMEKELPFPVYRVTAGSLADKIGARPIGGRYRDIPIPAFVAGQNGKITGLVSRHCTTKFKIVPIERKLRELVGLTRRRNPDHTVVTQWIGISLDEAHRMRDGRAAWLAHRYPLIEMRMTRGDCLAWLKRAGHPPPPKSSCVFCPFHSPSQWRALTPCEMDDAIAIDERLRSFPAADLAPRGALYLHRSAQPLRLIDFHAQLGLFDGDGFGDECEGVCGV